MISQRIIFIYGEPGSGRTTLAKILSLQVWGRLPILMPDWGSIFAWSHLEGEEVLLFDDFWPGQRLFTLDADEIEVPVMGRQSKRIKGPKLILVIVNDKTLHLVPKNYLLIETHLNK